MKHRTRTIQHIWEQRLWEIYREAIGYGQASYRIGLYPLRSIHIHCDQKIFTTAVSSHPKLRKVLGMVGMWTAPSFDLTQSPCVFPKRSPCRSCKSCCQEPIMALMRSARVIPSRPRTATPWPTTQTPARPCGKHPRRRGQGQLAPVGTRGVLGECAIISK